MQLKRNQWRTFAGVLALGFGIERVVWMLPDAMRAGVAPAAIGGLVTLGGFLAAKAYGEHRENARAPNGS
jgi:hypothetical protein